MRLCYFGTMAQNLNNTAVVKPMTLVSVIVILVSCWHKVGPKERGLLVPWGGGCPCGGRCGGVASRARALRPRLALHSAALNNHAYKSHLHFPAAVAAAVAAAAGPRRGAAGAVPDIAPTGGGGDCPELLTPGHGDTGFIYERVLAWKVWQANKYVKVRARRANVDTGSFLKTRCPVRCPCNSEQIM